MVFITCMVIQRAELHKAQWRQLYPLIRKLYIEKSAPPSILDISRGVQNVEVGNTTACTRRRTATTKKLTFSFQIFNYQKIFVAISLFLLPLSSTKRFCRKTQEINFQLPNFQLPKNLGSNKSLFATTIQQQKDFVGKHNKKRTKTLCYQNFGSL